jgi:hypothetical protein
LIDVEAPSLTEREPKSGGRRAGRRFVEWTSGEEDDVKKVLIVVVSRYLVQLIGIYA